MIVVDASAVLAIYFSEPEREAFLSRLLGEHAVMSPVNQWEVLVRAESADGSTGRQKAEELIAKLKIEIAAVDASTAHLAADTFARYGKRTPSNLNLGDCFAYALAKSRNAPLLFKGDDFTKTDITPA